VSSRKTAVNGTCSEVVLLYGIGNERSGIGGGAVVGESGYGVILEVVIAGGTVLSGREGGVVNAELCSDGNACVVVDNVIGDSTLLVGSIGGSVHGSVDGSVVGSRDGSADGSVVGSRDGSAEGFRFDISKLKRHF